MDEDTFALIQRGDFDSARTRLQQAIEAQPTCVHHRCDLASLEGNLGNLETSNALFRDVIIADPDNIVARLGLGWNLIQTGQHHHALVANIDLLRLLAQAEEIKELSVIESQAHNHLAIVFDQLAHFEKAAFHFTKAVKIEPKNHIAQKNLARFKELGTDSGFPRIEDGHLRIWTYDECFDYSNDIVNVDKNAGLLLASLVTTVGTSVDEGEVVKACALAYLAIAEELRKNPDLIYSLTWRQLEELVAATYDLAGFDEVILTPRSGDRGRDVIATKKGRFSIRIIDQVKAYRAGSKIAADDVRALYGTLQLDQTSTKAVFTTTSTFAPGVAKEFRNTIPYRLELRDGHDVCKWIEETAKSKRILNLGSEFIPSKGLTKGSG